jgi:hypothetical protein
MNGFIEDAVFANIIFIFFDGKINRYISTRMAFPVLF